MPIEQKEKLRKLDWDNIWITYGLAGEVLFAQKINDSYQLLDWWIEEKDGETYKLLYNFIDIFREIQVIDLTKGGPSQKIEIIK